MKLVGDAQTKFWNLDSQSNAARRPAKTTAAKNVTVRQSISENVPSNRCARDTTAIHGLDLVGRHLISAIMRPSAACLAPGFVKRSLDEFKRLSNIGEL